MDSNGKYFSDIYFLTDIKTHHVYKTFKYQLPQYLVYTMFLNMKITSFKLCTILYCIEIANISSDQASNNPGPWKHNHVLYLSPSTPHKLEQKCQKPLHSSQMTF